MFDIEPSWRDALANELQEPYIHDLQSFITAQRRLVPPVYPPEGQEFTALWKTPFIKTKVVVMGQDPYHGPGQAQGMSFSVNRGGRIPPSLQNIYKEIQSDVGIPIPTHGDLSSWAKQGVLLLNATLTVVEGKPMSHHGKGWERFTNAIVRALCKREDPVIFVLWGGNAKKKCADVLKNSESRGHHILTAPHPSPLSSYRGFFGCRHFSKINELLVSMNKSPIDWKV